MTVADLDRLTDEQRRNLARWARAPWSWFVSEATWQQRLDEYLRDADRRERAAAEAAAVERQRNYFATISRVTTYTGPDYRIQLDGHQSAVRAVAWQYKYAQEHKLPHGIGSITNHAPVAAEAVTV